MKRGRGTLQERLSSIIGGGVEATDAVRAIEELQREQVRLAEELERLLLVYDKRSRKLSKELARAMNGEPVQPERLGQLAEEQAALWKLIRRGQAAERGTRELEQELREWSAYPEPGVSTLHPDHPVQRIELIASELRSRGKDPSPLLAEERAGYEGSAQDVNVFEIEPDATVSDENEEEAPAASAWEPSGSEDALLREIASCQREIRRLLAHPEGEHAVQDIADGYEQLKELHAFLRRMDRHTGERRHRIAIGL